MELQRDSLKFLVDGFVLGLVNDLRPKGKLNFIQNCRIVTEGVLESRPAIEDIITLNPNPNVVPHDLKTILNESNNSFLRIAAAGTKIYTGNGAVLEEKDSNYSGKPLFMVDFRPEQSVEAYLYIADQNKFVKLSVSNDLSPVGIIAPTKAAVWSLAAPEKKIIDRIDVGSEASWNNLTGSASAPALISRVDTVVSAFLADGVLPNFASIVPNEITNINQGSVVTIGAQDIIVEEIIPAGLNAGVATINKISYDFGNSGAATIVLSVSNPELRRNSILQLGGAEFVRVEDVTRDSSGIPSVRVTTVGSFVAGATVTGFSSFRAYTPIAFANGNTIKNEVIKSTIGAGGISSVTRIVDADLLSTGTRSLTLESVLHISLSTDPSKITEIQIQLDVGDGSFKEYYYYAVSPNFFTASVTQTTPTIAVIQQSIQREELLNRADTIYGRLLRFADSGGYDPGVDVNDIYNGLVNTYFNNPQTVLGLSQWSELHIRLGDFKKVGADNTKTLKNVKAIRVTINATEATELSIDSIWVGGADSLDNISQGSFPYNYVWRVRDPKTRARSNWSPPLRTGIKLARGGVQLAFPDANVNYPADYRIDVARIGGTQTSFRIVGAIENNGSQFVDSSPDRLVADNDLAGRFTEHGSLNAVFDFFKPFAILDTPKRGKCNVVGTKLAWLNGDKFNVTYPRGTLITVNGKANTFYTSPTSDTEVELELDMGALNNVEFEIEDPLLTGQPLPVILGPVGEGFLGLYIFGIGDKNAAGTIYWLDGNSPDTQSDLNRLEITSPSEPLVSGVIYDGYAFVWSTARSFVMQPTIASDGSFGFIARENANSRGLFCRSAITVGPSHIYFLSENADGIYQVEGNGNPQCITAGGFSNLFFNNGKEPSLIKLVDGTIIYPPDFTAIDELRLFCTNDYLFFRFKDINQKFVALVYDIELKNFISYDTYEGHDANAFYKEELKAGTNILIGTVDGVGKFSSNGEEEVTSKVIPFSFDAGDSRALKEFKEIVIDADQGEEGFTIRNFYSNGTESDPNQNFVGSVQHNRQQFIVNLQNNDGVGKIAKNITTTFEWPITNGAKIYEEIIYFLPKADQIINRSSDTENNGNLASKLWQGVVLRANTFGEDKELKFFDDKGILKTTLVINHDGEQTLSYGFNNPFISHTIKRTSTDAVEWILLDEAYVTDAEPEAAKVWEGEFNTHDLTGLILIERMGIAYRAYGSAVKLTLFFEDETTQVYDNILPNTDGEYNKEFFFVSPKKWKACKYRFDSDSNVRIYKRDSEVWMKSVGSDRPFARFSPFGGSSRETEILI